jgi:MFS family permease
MDELTVFFLINIATAISYSLPIPLYTKIAYSRGFSESFVGFVFSVYSLANIAMIPFTNKLIEKIGRFNLLIIACLTNAFSTLLFISLEIVIEQMTFIVISIFSRSVQGLSIELINILIFSLASNSGEISEAGKNLSFVEMATSIGLIIGPFLSFCFGGFGYSVPFLICLIFNLFTIYLLLYKTDCDIEELNRLESEEEFSIKSDQKSAISLPLKKINSSLRTNIFSNIKARQSLAKIDKEDSILLLHNRRCFSVDELDNDISEEDASEYTKDSNESLEANDIDYSYKNKPNHQLNAGGFLALITKKEIIWVFIAVIVDYICQSFFTPVFTLVMEQNYNVDVEFSSAILSLMYFVYFISLRYIGYLLDIFPPKYLMCLGLLINSFAVLLLNPIHLFPQKLFVSIFGFCLLNAIGCFVTISSLVDFTHSLKKKGFNEYFANDTSSALYALAINIAELLGPLIGGILTNMRNFEFATVIIGSSNLLLSILFIILFGKKFYGYLIRGKIKKMK